MKTQEQIKKEIEEIEKECWESVQSHFPIIDRESYYDFELKENYHHYKELQALLNYSNEIIKEIEKWGKHCGFACDYQNVQELKQSIIGERK